MRLNTETSDDELRALRTCAAMFVARLNHKGVMNLPYDHKNFSVFISVSLLQTN